MQKRGKGSEDKYTQTNIKRLVRRGGEEKKEKGREGKIREGELVWVETKPVTPARG